MLGRALVKSAKDYKWSGFRAFYFDSQEPLPVDHDWWWPDDAEKLTKALKTLGWRDYTRETLRAVLDSQLDGAES